MLRTYTILFIFLAILYSFELYTYFSLKPFYSNPQKKYRKLTKWYFFISLFISTISILVLMTIGNEMPMNIRNFFVAFIFINAFSKLLYVLFTLADDFRRLILKLFHLFRPQNPKKIDKDGISRSDFLTKMGIAVAAVPALGLPFGMAYGPYRYTIHRNKLKFSNLPKAFHGLKIVQISDIHSGSFYDKAAVQKGIDMILAQKPDVIFFTGDIVNDQASEMDDYYDVFSQLKAPMGVYSILGNHDYGDYHQWESEAAKQDNFERVVDIHRKLGWRLLRNEHLYLNKDEEKIALVGVENWGKGFHQAGDLDLAMQGCEADFKLLLSHDPTHWDEKVRPDYKDIDITFSGHTHGAQLGVETHGFKWSPIQLRYDKWAGLYERDGQYLYVNRGFGFLAYPGRLGIWPEVTVLELESEA